MNSNITIIPARKQRGNTITSDRKPKLRVAAYCRVSTDSEEQASSYETQVNHYSDYIKRNIEWEFAGIYADDGISGTNTKKREEFNRLIEDCMVGKIDMVITKSISRFARNTVDCLNYIRQLKEKNIPVYFEKENIKTTDSQGEVLLTIMASLAQQESESLSKNVKMGIQFRYQKGQIQVNHNRFMGYTKDENGKLVIEPTEAKVIKRIYYEYLQGASLKQISEGLMEDGILTGAGKPTWRAEGIRKILRNEKYMGDALLQKTYTVDVLTKKRVANNGIVPQYYVEGCHEAIIPKDLYMQVQEEMSRRANLHSGKDKNKRVYSSKYALSSIVHCEKCGEIYRRISWRNRGKHSIVWRCVNRVEKGPECCDAPTIKEIDLQNGVVEAINMIMDSKEDVKRLLEDNIASVLAEEDENSLESINARLLELQKELLAYANAKKDYSDIADEIDRQRELKRRVMVDKAEREGYKKRIDEMKTFLAMQITSIDKYDETMVRRMVEKITVYEGKIVVEFKSGANVEVEI